jgi:TonB-dependent SusC/RagA subfamily outer membrane receptor
MRASRMQLEEMGERAESPLIVLDGVITSESLAMKTLSPESIERIEVVKGAAARALYDHPRAANGVIRITTKGGGR